MIASSLLDVVCSLSEYDDSMTIYARKPWTVASAIVVAKEPESGGLPEEAAVSSMSYFLEVFIAREFLAGLVEREARHVPSSEQCERLIRYAIQDA